MTEVSSSIQHNIDRSHSRGSMVSPNVAGEPELAMKNMILFGRVLLLSIACAVPLVEDSFADESIAFTFAGTVHSPDGSPVAGAVVVSTSGGKAVTNEQGEYELEAYVSMEAKSVQVTAVGAGNDKLLASQQVSLSAASTNVTVAPIQLAQASACTPSWLPVFGGDDPGPNQVVQALEVFDDGTGPALYVGGGFTRASGVTANYVAKWDGTNWSSLGTGVDNGVRSLCVFDDGTGPALFAGGDFQTAGGAPASHIAKWDGSNWSTLGTGITGNSPPLLFVAVEAMTVYDDGTGDQLYVGGMFNVAGGVSANRIAKWDGVSWAALGTGINPGTTFGFVNALTVFDDGSGAALYVGGSFYNALGVAADNIAKWDGLGWSALASGFNVAVYALIAFDDGSGMALYAGGNFSSSGGVTMYGIAKWDGTSWAAVGNGLFGVVRDLTVFDDGSGPALYALGGFPIPASGLVARFIAKWDGSSWSAEATGLSAFFPYFLAMTEFDDGSGNSLFVGGHFTRAGTAITNRIAKWDGVDWAGLGTSTNKGMNSIVRTLAVFDDGSGPALFVGGQFDGASGAQANQVAKWDGSSWTPLGSGPGITDVFALAVFDDGTGAALYAGGLLSLVGGVLTNSIAKWDGSSWAPLGSGVNSSVRSLLVHDDGSGDQLYVGGRFTTAGGIAANYVAKWDGSNWAPLGSGLDGFLSGTGVYALTVFDDGNGEQLVAGGKFITAGGVAANAVAQWDGASWAPLGAGVRGGNGATVYALAVWDDGSGEQLFVGGNLTVAANLSARYIAKWDGANWSALDGGFGRSVYALTVFNDGGGSLLYAGGDFNRAGGATENAAAANRIATWDGTRWQAVGSGMNNAVSALTTFDDGGGPALYAGGFFTRSGGVQANRVAKLGCAPVLTDDLCNGDGGDQLGCTECPCSNNATLGTIGGCLNSAATSARLFVSGDPAVNLLPGDTSDLRFSLTSAPPATFCILVSGDGIASFNAVSPCFGLDSGVQAIAFDGLRCAIQNTRRHGIRSADSTGDVGVTNSPWGGEGEPSAGLVANGSSFAGQTRIFQVIYRDDPSAQCMRGFNSSQAVRVTFTPGI